MYFADGIIIGIVGSMALMCLIAFAIGWLWLVKIINDFKNLAETESNKNTDS